MKLFYLTFAALSCLRCTHAQQHEQIVLGESTEREIMNVAVIGAGAAGASAAYHLSNFSSNAGIPVNITIFERNPYIGGRSTTVNAYNDSNFPVELGASIFVDVNYILSDAVKEFNLSTKAFILEVEIPGAALAVWDGQDIVISQYGKNSWWDTAKLLWRYGLAPIRTMRLMKSVVGKYLILYDKPYFPFTSLTQVAQDVGLLAVTAATGEQYLEENGIYGLFGREVVQASTRVNYAQNLKYIHGLEAMVCMAAENARSVDGGNWQIFENMIAASNATPLLSTEVTGITKMQSGSYVLQFSNVTDESQQESGLQVFDAVILAAPYQFSKISLVDDVSADSVPQQIPYVELHVTLFTSPHLLSPEYFNMASGSAAPRVVLTTLPKNEEPQEGSAGVGSPGFFSVSLLDPITNPTTQGQEYLYKIFSASPPNSTFLSNLLGLNQTSDTAETEISNQDITWMYRKVWNSYPYEFPRVTFENIQLGENLWYTSGMDSFISTMETNAFMGMNVARLMVDQWINGSGMSGGQGEIKEPSMLPESESV